MAKKSFVLHDESVNTHGFRMLTSGVNLDEFRKNPVMLLNHSNYDLPIGRWDNIRIEGGKILADPVFDEGDAVGREVKRKVDSDFLRMASIGAWPPEEVSADAMYKLPGQKGSTVTRWTAREASVVTIGANHNALAFYDRKTGNPIDLNDQYELIRLFDDNTIIHENKDSMKELAGILNLADTATENEIADAVRVALSDRDRLKTENDDLLLKVTGFETAAADARKAEAIALVDGAVKDGRIEAKGKDTFLKLFDTDFDSAKATLEAIPVRKSVTAQIDESKGQNAVELADLKGKTWDELDRSGKLVMLRDKYPDVYEEKYVARFGQTPKAV